MLVLILINHNLSFISGIASALGIYFYMFIGEHLALLHYIKYDSEL
jgi:hypothetical protein